MNTGPGEICVVLFAFSLGCFETNLIYLKEYSTFTKKFGYFYNSPRVKQLSFTVYESIQLISGTGFSAFSLA